MAKLKRLKPALAAIDPRRKNIIASERMTGRGLQSRRLRLWSRDPHCANCGRVTQFPDGFELDHINALVNGGEDTDDNCQVLCPSCHKKKTAADTGTAYRPQIGLDGWPVED